MQQTSKQGEKAVASIMIPVVPAVTQTKALDRKTPESSQGSFSDHLEKTMAAEQRKEKNLLGVKNRQEAKASQQKTTRSDSGSGKAKEKDGHENTVAGLLGQLMLRLKELAEKGETGPGEWTFTLPDSKLVEQIGREAGMTEAEISLLLKQMEDQQGKFSLGNLLAGLARHFERQQEEKPVTVPETDLPLLETFLSRMGVPVEEISRISDQAVTGDNRLDLGKFLEGLEESLGLQKEAGRELAGLSDWEAEQLQDILAKAGVSASLSHALLPERGNRQVSLSIERLADMLRQGINEVENNRLKPDAAAFLADLDTVLRESGFARKTVGWSPAVQDSVANIYNELLESVDLATVRIDGAKNSGMAESGRQAEEQLNAEAQEELEGWFASAEGGEQEKPVNKAGKPTIDGAPVNNRMKPGLGDETDAAAAGELFESHPDPAQTSGAGPGAGRDDLPGIEGPRPAAAPAMRLPVQLAQQTFETISQGVVRGLQNQEHHLVLRLYPKELGEVKVEMLVRDDHVAVSFAMENTKVKNVLESNMQQFQDNLAKQGFILEECMVSLNQQHEQHETWQRFESAWKEQQAGRPGLAGPGDEVLYVRAPLMNRRDDGVDLFA